MTSRVEYLTQGVDERDKQIAEQHQKLVTLEADMTKREQDWKDKLRRATERERNNNMARLLRRVTAASKAGAKAGARDLDFLRTRSQHFVFTVAQLVAMVMQRVRRVDSMAWLASTLTRTSNLSAMTIAILSLSLSTTMVRNTSCKRLSTLFVADVRAMTEELEGLAAADIMPAAGSKEVRVMDNSHLIFVESCQDGKSLDDVPHGETCARFSPARCSQLMAP